MNKQRVGIIERHFTKLSPEEILALIDEMEEAGTLPLLLAQCETVLRLSTEAGRSGETMGIDLDSLAPKRTGDQELWLVHTGPKDDGVPRMAMIRIIKAIREHTALGLKEAKALYDIVHGGTPQRLCVSINPEFANRIISDLTDLGATVEVR